MNEFNENGNQVEPQPEVQEAQYIPEVQQSGSQGMSIAGLVMGIISIVAACCSPILGIICGALGLTFGIIGMKKEPIGKGKAKAGVIMASIALGLAVINWIVGALIIASNPYIYQNLLRQFGL